MNENDIFELTKEERFFNLHYEEYKKKYEKIKHHEYIYVVDTKDPMYAYKPLTPKEYIYEQYHKKHELKSKKHCFCVIL